MDFHRFPFQVAWGVCNVCAHVRIVTADKFDPADKVTAGIIIGGKKKLKMFRTKVVKLWARSANLTLIQS